VPALGKTAAELKTYVYGSTYVKQVRISGLRVTRYSGQLFSVSCPS